MVTKKETAEKTESGRKLPKLGFSLQAINKLLATLFYSIWLVIGVFFLIVIYSQIKQGALKSVFGSTPTPAPVEQQQQPKTEANVPGVGKVNIVCVEAALSQESIQKLVTEGSTNSLTADEKIKLEPCIVEKAAASVTPQP